MRYLFELLNFIKGFKAWCFFGFHSWFKKYEKNSNKVLHYCRKCGKFFIEVSKYKLVLLLVLRAYDPPRKYDPCSLNVGFFPPYKMIEFYMGCSEVKGVRVYSNERLWGMYYDEVSKIQEG